MAGYKINIRNSVEFLYTNNELSEREIKTISSTIASKRIKYLEINLTKEVKDLSTENCKTLMKKNWRHDRNIFHAHGLEELILLKFP